MKRKTQRKRELKPTEVIHFEIEDDVFKKHFDVYIGNRAKVIKMFEKRYPPLKGCDTFEPGYAGLCVQLRTTDDEGATFVLWMDSLNYEVIVHELFHAVYDALKIDGIRLTDDTNECFAYYLGFLFKKVREGISKAGF
jgi:hypothetical protein